MAETRWGFKALEKKYPVKVVSEGVFNSVCDKKVETFRIITADGRVFRSGLFRSQVKQICESRESDILCIAEIEEKKKNGYKYYTIYRPVSPGTFPKDGIITHQNFDRRTSIDGVEAWGILWYSRELTDKELRDYELVKAN